MATKNPHAMTDRMWAFCRRYVEQGFTDAAKAYRHSYANCKSQKAAESHASRLLTHPKVAAYLAEVKDKAKERTQITADRVLEELGKLGFANMEDYVEFGPGGVTLNASEGMTRDTLAAVSEVSESVTKDGGSIRFKLHDKRAALESIGKHFGMFTDKRDAEHGGEPGEQMTTEEMWEGILRLKSIEQLEREMVAHAKKQIEEAAD